MSLRKRLITGELTLSTVISEVRNPNLARMLATAGLDSMIIDMEHGTFGWPDMSVLIAVARGCGLAPVVRIPEIRREAILKPLDAGAAGILVPMVNSVEEARGGSPREVPARRYARDRPTSRAQRLPVRLR